MGDTPERAASDNVGRALCLPSSEEIPLCFASAFGESSARSIPSSSPHRTRFAGLRWGPNGRVLPTRFFAPTGNFCGCCNWALPVNGPQRPYAASGPLSGHIPAQRRKSGHRASHGAAWGLLRVRRQPGNVINALPPYPLGLPPADAHTSGRPGGWRSHPDSAWLSSASVQRFPVRTHG